MTKKERKERALRTRIVDIPGLSQQAKRRMLLHYHRQEIDKWLDAQPPSLSDEERQRENKLFRSEKVEERTLSEVRGRVSFGDVVRDNFWRSDSAHCRTPPSALKVLFRFAEKHGLTRLDWPMLPYKEKRVMRQLRLLSDSDFGQVPILVFGFLDTDSMCRWLCEYCSAEKAEDITISDLLLVTGVYVSERIRRCVPIRHLRKTLRSLLNSRGVRGRHEILKTEAEVLTESLMREDGLSRRNARKFIEIGRRRFWIPKYLFKE